jgi:hypothetical protein
MIWITQISRPLCGISPIEEDVNTINWSKMYTLNHHGKQLYCYANIIDFRYFNFLMLQRMRRKPRGRQNFTPFSCCQEIWVRGKWRRYIGGLMTGNDLNCFLPLFPFFQYSRMADPLGILWIVWIIICILVILVAIKGARRAIRGEHSLSTGTTHYSLFGAD